MTTSTEAAAQRVRAYVLARAKTRVLSHDVIHQLIDWSDDTPSAEWIDVPLLVSDLCLLVDAVLDPDEPTPQDVDTEYDQWSADQDEIDAARTVRVHGTPVSIDDYTRQPETGPDQGA